MRLFSKFSRPVVACLGPLKVFIRSINGRNGEWWHARWYVFLGSGFQEHYVWHKGRSVTNNVDPEIASTYITRVKILKRTLTCQWRQMKFCCKEPIRVYLFWRFILAESLADYPLAGTMNMTCWCHTQPNVNYDSGIHQLFSPCSHLFLRMSLLCCTLPTKPFYYFRYFVDYSNGSAENLFHTQLSLKYSLIVSLRISSRLVVTLLKSCHTNFFYPAVI